MSITREEISSSSKVPLLSSSRKGPPIANRNAFIVNSATSVLWLVFKTLDFFLYCSSSIWQKFNGTSKKISESESSVRPKTIVIVGGNFAGLAALWELLSWRKSGRIAKDVRIVLIDQRDYFEYTPGILRLFCEPGHFFRLAQLLPRSKKQDKFERIQGIVKSIVRRNRNENESYSYNPTKSDEAVAKVLTYLPYGASPKNESTNVNVTKSLEYDYLILATGSNYTAPISPASNNVCSSNLSMLGRYREWKDAHDRLRESKRILILGGGAVGVELAAEIVDYENNSNQNSRNSTSRTTVTIVDAQTALVPLFPRPVGAYAEDWLTKRGVELRLGESLKSWNDRSCTMANGTVLQADVVYVCFGNRPNSSPVASPNILSASSTSNGSNTIEQRNSSKSNTFFALSKREHVVVRDTLQVVISSDSKIFDDDPTLSPWFSCGDVASPPTNDEKQAFQAEMQGKVAARNIIKLVESTTTYEGQVKLLRYPQDIAGADRIPLVFVLSLGRFDGVLGFNNMCLPGPVAAIVKWILEHTKVSHMQGRVLGKLIWKIGDAVTLFISRTILRPPFSIPPVPGTTSGSHVSTPNTPASSAPASLFSSRQQLELEQQLKLS